MPERGVSQVPVVALREGSLERRDELVAAEEPLEIRVEQPGGAVEPLAVTMRTPGADLELALGFLVTEGLLDSVADLAEPLAHPPRQAGPDNVVTLRLRRTLDLEGVRRNFYATSSCGVCGKASIERVEIDCPPVGPGPVVSTALLSSLAPRLREAQALFERTGGLHATGLFDASGALLAVREDVGRHNAMDKVVGAGLLRGELPFHERIAVVSGRASFELVQKAAMAGVPILCSVSAPSSLAVSAAERLGLTLVGFLRGDRMTVYAGAARVADAAK